MVLHDLLLVAGEVLAQVVGFAETGEEVSEDRAYSMFFTALEAGYVWAWEVSTFRITGGVAFLADFWSERDEEGGGRNAHVDSTLMGWASVGLGVHALDWLSLGLDAGLGAGGSSQPGFGLFGVVSATLTFHL